MKISLVSLCVIQHKNIITVKTGGFYGYKLINCNFYNEEFDCVKF